MSAECCIGGIRSETQKLINDPAVVIETEEQRKDEDGRFTQRKKKENKEANA